MGCGHSSNRPSMDKAKVTPMPGCFMATYQLQPSYAYSEKHGLYVEDHKQVENLPPPHPPPTNKRDIFQIEKYRVLDKRADKAPNKLTKEPYANLMAYLMNGVHDDLSKVRVIYRWVTSLKMERTLLPREQPSAATPLFQIWRIKNRKGNYAQLVSILCRLAGIPCAIIHGRLKGSTYDVGQKVNDKLHYGEWNAVLINNYWRLINAYWGACAIGSEGSDDWLEIDDGGEDETEKKADNKISTKEYVYMCDENYFLTDPRQLITTHLPFSKEWQLLSTPINMDRFERMAFLKDRFFNLGMTVITHQDSVIQSHSGETEICFGMPPDDAKFYKFYYLLFRQESKGTGGFSPKYDRYVFMHRPKKDELSVRIRSPVTGTFRLELVGRDTRIKDPYYDYDWVVLYKISFLKAKEKCLPFPNMPDLGWGPGAYSMQLGLSPLSHSSGEVKANWCGEAEISFEICDYNRLGNPLFFGRLAKSGTQEEKLRDRVIHRVENGKVIFNVKLPKRGEYSLGIDGTSGKKPLPRNFANYMLVSDQRVGQMCYPRGFEEGIGRKPACSRFNIDPLNHCSGLIRTQTEEFEIDFKVNPTTELSLSVIGNDVMVSDSRRLVTEIRKDDDVKYKIRLPKEGTYGVKVIGKPFDQRQFESIYDYIVEYRDPEHRKTTNNNIGGHKAGGSMGADDDKPALNPLGANRPREFQSPPSVSVEDSAEDEIRKRIDVAIEAEDEYELAATLDELMLTGVNERGQTEIARLKHELQIISMKKDLLGAVNDRSLKELVNAITVIKEKGHEHRMVKELREATKMMERLQHIQNLLHDVQTMTQKLITEIRGYSSPPPAVHRVMMATLLLLGHYEEETQWCRDPGFDAAASRQLRDKKQTDEMQRHRNLGLCTTKNDWLKLQAIIGKTGKESIKRRCEELNLDKVPLDIALGARELLKDYTLDQCRMVSSGAATFYVWAKGIVDEIVKRNAEDVAHTRPRTSRSRRARRQYD